MRKRHFPFYLLLFAIAIIPVLIDDRLKILGANLHWENEPLHSTMEAVGALVAIFMASILFLKQKEKTGRKIYLLSLGFIGMGILDGFHAISKPGEIFVFLHSLASLVGGFWFVVIWFPSFIAYLCKKDSIPWIATIGSFICGIWFYLLPEAVPTMIHNGEFTTTAITINTLAGIMFLIATFRFLLDFNHFEKIEFYMFACMSLLFSIAELTFYKSTIWGSGWWLWHLLRLIAYVIVLLFIIRQYIKTSDNLKNSEENYRSLIETQTDLVCRFNPDGTIFFVNEVFSKFFNKPIKELVGSMWQPLPVDDDVHLIEAELAKLAPDNPIVSIENRVFSGKGEIHWMQFINKGIFDHNKNLMGIQSVGRDITDRKQAEEKLLLQGNVLDQINDHVTITDLDGAITYINQAQERAMGFNTKDVVGQMTDVYGEDSKLGATQKEILENTLKDGAWRGEVVNKTKDGYEVFIDCRTQVISNKDDKPICMVGIGTDITERKKAEKGRIKLESQLQQAQKMESIGTLAGGIAHDFNNILFPIVGHTEMLLEDIPNSSPLNESLNEIYTGAMRAKELVKQILTFSRQENTELKLIKILPIIKEALKLIRHTIPTTIEIKQDIQADCGPIKADPTQIHQVIMNLSTNAYHAMEETGGVLNIRLKEVEFGESDLFNPDIKPPKYARLSISDTGKGMDKDTIKKIFDPFFTTKETGKGTGMGLSVVHGIVKSMNGTIKVDSRSDKGTEFHIYLPVFKNLTEKKELQTEKPIQSGTERILLVDDEESIILMEKNMLERLDYQVTSRTSSIEALEAFRAAPSIFDIVITDMQMPNMTGDKFASELTKIRPDIPVLLCTGFSETMSEEKAESLGINGFLLKPIVMKDLSHKIREVLDNNKVEKAN